MRKTRFFQVDVFTESPFGGNPVAVIPQAIGIPESQMQTIARGMRPVETAFVLPSTVAHADFKVVCFTPTTKVPFSGHTSLGASYVLAQEGFVDLVAPVTQIRQEIDVGVLPIDLHVEDGNVTRVVMTEQTPVFLNVLEDAVGVAAALGCDPVCVGIGDLPLQVVSTGLSALIVPMQSLEVVQDVIPRVSLLNAICQQVRASSVLVFSLETLNPSSTAHVRLFAPLLGVHEDPATGSANGALGAYLVRYQAVSSQEPVTRIITEQGYEVGRPCTIYIEVRSQEESLEVRVGGQVARSLEGYVYY